MTSWLASLALLAAGACQRDDARARAADQPSSGAVAAATESAPATNAAPVAMTVYKTPTCGCCTAWVDRMRAAGPTVTTVDWEDLAPVKAEHGVPDTLASCHTAVVDAGGGTRYVVEGHVPAADVRRLLAERPAVLGIAVPGMPRGSPGMEMPGAPPDRYDVVSFVRGGPARVFASH